MSKPLNADEQQYRFAHNPLADKLFHTFRAMVTEKGVDAALADIAEVQAADRTEKLKLLAEVRERVVDKPTGNHNADSLLERDVLIYNQATAYLRTELTKLEAEL